MPILNSGILILNDYIKLINNCKDLVIQNIKHLT